MKMKWIVPMLAAALIAGACQKKQGDKKSANLDNKEKKVSYVLGMQIAQEVKSTGMTFDIDSLVQGLRDNIGGKVTLSEAEVNETLKQFQLDMRTQRGQKGLQQEEAFLLENGRKPDIKTTASGLQYKVITEGKGLKPKETDTVRVHYRGYLPNNQEFDSSYKRGQPTEFPLNGVIKGWIEGLQLMSVGSKYQLFIPAKLAYGERGAGSMIGPNQVLIFDVELLEIVKPTVPAPAKKK